MENNKKQHVVITPPTIKRLKELKEFTYKKQDYFLSFGAIVNIAVKEYHKQVIKEAAGDEENKKSD